jgi:hypothetical protein
MVGVLKRHPCDVLSTGPSTSAYQRKVATRTKTKESTYGKEIGVDVITVASSNEDLNRMTAREAMEARKHLEEDRRLREASLGVFSRYKRVLNPVIKTCGQFVVFPTREMFTPEK